MDIATLQSIWTLLVFLFFIGIVAWAWSGKNAARFERAARLPLDDDDGVNRTHDLRGDTHHV